MACYYAAFYRGAGDLADWAIRRATRSAFSHVELIRAPERPRLGEVATCLSSSKRDGGVRIKDIRLHPAKWRIYDICWAPDDAWDRAAERIGLPYEFWTMVISQRFNRRITLRDHWFCSELVADALRLDMPHLYAPGDLLRAIRDHSDTWEDARASLRPDRAARIAAMDDEAEGLAS